jgi:hypothetical protein
LLSGTASESDPLLFFLRRKLGLLASFHEHFLCIFGLSWFFCSFGDTFSEKVMIFEPIFSLWVTILQVRGSGGSSGGLSNWRKVRGGGESAGGLRRLSVWRERRHQIGKSLLGMSFRRDGFRRGGLFKAI